MRITFTCAVFPPEPAPSGIMARQLARCLARDDHRVCMIVPFPNRPEGVVHQGYRRKLWQVEATESAQTVRCAHWPIGKQARMALSRRSDLRTDRARSRGHGLEFLICSSPATGFSDK